MKMSNFFLAGVYFFLMATSGYSALNSPNIEQIINKGHRIEVPFDIGQYKIYAYFSGNALPPEADAAAFAIRDNEVKQIGNIDDLSSITNGIKTEEEALYFVRLFTNSETEFLFKDPDLNGIELLQEEKYVTRIPSNLLGKIKEQHISIVEDTENFHISRILLMRDKSTPEGIGIPILVKTNETLSRAGKYKFAIEAVLPGGEQLSGISRNYR